MVINVFGRRGSGKTTLIRGNLQYCRKPIIIIDVLGNFDNPEFLQVTDLETMLDALKQFHEKKHEQDIICLKTSNPTTGADYGSAAIWEMGGGTLILDEVDSIKMKEGSCFDEYIRYGRNHHGDLITGCRRPAELDRNITAAANKFYCFQTHEYRDIEYFQNSLFGESAEALMNLPKYSGMFLDYDASTIGTFHIDINGNVYHDSENALE